MINILKNTKGKIIICLIVIALVTGSILGYFIFKNNKKLIFDYEKGKIASNVIETAQYAPDMNKYFDNLSINIESSAKNSDNKKLKSTNINISEDEESFLDIVNNYSNIEAGGKYLGYDIYEIKSEIVFVIEHIPAFNQWFRMPYMGTDDGYVSHRYNSQWAYYVELDENLNKLSITRVSWAIRSEYIDFDTGKARSWRHLRSHSLS